MRDMRDLIKIIEHIENNNLIRAIRLFKSGTKLLYHSGLSSQAENIGKYGLEPTNSGEWVREIATGNFDSDEDMDEALSATVPVTWMDDKPKWVFAKAARSSGKSVSGSTIEDISKHGHLAIINAHNCGADIYYIGDDGLSNGPYSIIYDIDGNPVKFFKTNLYAFDDLRQMDTEPFGIERNEYISADTVDVEINLIGEDVVKFLMECFPEILKKKGR